jgi:hypothetical protein
MAGRQPEGNIKGGDQPRMTERQLEQRAKWHGSNQLYPSSTAWAYAQRRLRAFWLQKVSGEINLYTLFLVDTIDLINQQST